MPKVMLINVTHSEESRVGIMNEGVLESFEIESLSRAHLKGNIYKGVVHRIHPALEAAFVDIGAERDAFLPLDEICFKTLENPPKPAPRGEASNGGRRQYRIRELLRPGQEILVQITKEQFANKPPTVSTFYSLPGRYLVLLPGSEDTGISRRIEGDERDRLRKLVDALNPGDGFGLIVRTVAGLEENGNDLPRDLDYLKRLWANVQAAAKGRPAPSLVYREHDIVQRAIRDFYTPDITEIHIDDEDVFHRAKEFLASIMPGSDAVLRLYRGEQPLFSAFRVEEQIESVFGRRVRLKSGGSIVIDGTEALTAIDVNSGGAVRGANPEDTAYRTNREAATEVARQLRLRDIGGIVVVDFIDMREPQHIREIEQLVRDEMRLDKARHETSRLSSLGLMQISRQRLRPAAAASSHATCPLCQGYGSVRTHASAALGAIRKIHNRLSLGDVESMVVTLPTEVGLYVLNQKRDDLVRLESRYESTVEIRLDPVLLPHEVETEAKERSRTSKAGKVIEPGGVAEGSDAQRPATATKGVGPVEVAKTAEATRSADGENGSKRRKRRRRRRGGARPEGEGGAAPTQPSATGGQETETVRPREAEQSAASPMGSSSTEADGIATTTSSTAPASASGADEATPRGESEATSGEARPKPADNGASSTAPGESRGRRSRGRRGGRRNRPGERSAVTAATSGGTTDDRARTAAVHSASAQNDSAASAETAAAPRSTAVESAVAPAASPPPSEAAAKPRATTRKRAASKAASSTADGKPAAAKSAARKTTTKKAATKAAAKKPARKTAAKKTTAAKKRTTTAAAKAPKTSAGETE